MTSNRKLLLQLGRLVFVFAAMGMNAILALENWMRGETGVFVGQLISALGLLAIAVFACQRIIQSRR